MAFTKTQIGIAVGTAAVLVLVFVGYLLVAQQSGAGAWRDRKITIRSRDCRSASR